MNNVFFRWFFNAGSFSPVSCDIRHYWVRMRYSFFTSVCFHSFTLYLFKRRDIITLIKMLPKRTKFLKRHSRKCSPMKTPFFKPLLNYGSIGLIANQSSLAIAEQITATLRLVKKGLKKQSKI